MIHGYGTGPPKSFEETENDVINGNESRYNKKNETLHTRLPDDLALGEESTFTFAR